MSLVQAGANVAAVWPTFVRTFPAAANSQPITFQQMVVCEVLTQVAPTIRQELLTAK